MSGFVYIWFDRKHRRYYVGCHWGSIDDGYICSSSWMKRAYKHRYKDFKRRILKIITTTRKDLFDEEQRYLHMIKDEELGKRYYNIRKKGDYHWANSEEKVLLVREKISKTKTGVKTGPISEEKREKLRQAALKRYANMPAEERSKIAHKPQGFGDTMSKALTGLPVSDAKRAAIEKSLKIGREKNRVNKPGMNWRILHGIA